MIMFSLLIKKNLHILTNLVKTKLFKYLLMQFHNFKRFNNKIQLLKLIFIIISIILISQLNLDLILQK